MKQTVRMAECIGVEGDVEEFDDLIGTKGKKGKLRLDPKSTEMSVNWFNGGDPVNFARKRVTEKDGIVKVFTTLGNVFKFRLITAS